MATSVSGGVSGNARPERRTAHEPIHPFALALAFSHHLNVDNTSNSPREGYKDNRARYFFGSNSLAHLQKFASSGVLALLFGRGEGPQSSYTNGYYTDGKLFMKSRAGAAWSGTCYVDSVEW